MQSLISAAHGNLAWNLLFAKHFPEAEVAAREGLATDPSQIWINTNLALALLYQGKFEEAKALYLRFKDQTIDEKRFFKAAFLQDLRDLEAAGITHPDVTKIRWLLE